MSTLVAYRAARLLADTASLGIALSTPIAAGDWRLLFLRNEHLQQLKSMRR